MGPPTSDEGFAELFAHQEWVRRLALQLCGDAASAEDVVQATWVEALRGRGEARSVRSWLGGIVRHISRREQRTARARAEREARVARDEAMPSPESLLARAELQRRVLSAVASLDESYRVVVLMRWYEDLRSEEIATRLGVPSSTVRNRLARAHERLRAKLDREYGGDHAAWSALLVPHMSWSASHTVAAGVLTLKVKLVAAVVVVALVAAVLWRRSEGEVKLADGLSTSSAAALAAQSNVESPTPAARSASSSERAPVASPPAAAVEHVLVWGEIHGANAAQLADGSLAFVDENGLSHPASVSKNDTYSVFGVKPGRCRIQGGCRGVFPLDEDLVLAPDQAKVRHDITFQRALVLPVKIIAKDSGKLFKAPREWGCDLAVVATLAQPTRIESVLSRSAGYSGVGGYREQSPYGGDASIPADCSGVLQLLVNPPVYASCVLRDTVLESRIVQGNESELVFEVDLALIESKFGSLAVRCVDGVTGNPIRNATVAVEFQDATASGVKTDADGRVEIPKLAPGMRSLTVAADGFASVRQWIRVPAGERLDVGSVELRPPATVRGRVIDSEGHGVSAHLHAIPLRAFSSTRGADTRSSFEAAKDGTFAVTRVESGKLRLVAEREGLAITTVDVDASSGTLDGVEVRMEKGTSVMLTPTRGAHIGCQIVIADATGQPIEMSGVYPMSRARVCLKPGHYELRVLGDEAVLRTEMLEVGSEPIVREVQVP